ncbi:MAG: metal ABC transporter solute-binding protein, Zn/Mn family [Gammaproteobacteria bacterium]
MTTTSLPWDLQGKAGHFFTEFGRNNSLHPHSWAWIDQPLINTRLFGGDGSRAPGARLSWLLPTPWYSEVYLGAQNGNHETLVSFLGAREDAEGGIGGLSATKDDVDNLTDLLYLARWANSWDLNQAWSTQIGLSALHGPNATGNHGETWIYGTDLVAKWRPSNSYRPTTQHLQDLVRRMQTDVIKIVITAAYFDPRHGQFLAKHTGAQVLTLANQVGARPGTDDYLAMIDYNVKQLAAALGQH